MFPMQVSAALASNFGDGIDATSISALGNESTGLSTGQIMMMKPQDIVQALSTLGSVMGWNDGQASAIIELLMSSGLMEVATGCHLLNFKAQFET